MNETIILPLLRVAAMLAVFACQYAIWMHATRSQTSRRVRAMLTGIFVAMNLPGFGIVFHEMDVISASALEPVRLIYILWIAGTAIWWVCHVLMNLRNERQDATDQSHTQSTNGRAGGVETAADEGRRAFLREGFAGIAVIGAGSIVPVPSGSEDLEIVHQRIRLPNLSPKHHGLRIAVMSDIHSGPNMKPDELAPYFEALRGLNADMVFLPGDFVNTRNEEIEPICAEVRTLRAPYGVYGVTGNHDYFADAEYVSRALREAGVIMLRNEHKIITPNGARLAIIGIDDVRKGHPFDYQFAKAVKGLDRSIPHILLCHKPEYFDDAAEWGVNLMVSGHTHGGQVVVGRIFGKVITPAAIYSGYVAGHYTVENSQLYVTRGIGVVIFPFRLNCPPEITVLTLHA